MEGRRHQLPACVGDQKANRAVYEKTTLPSVVHGIVHHEHIGLLIVEGDARN